MSKKKDREKKSTGTRWAPVLLSHKKLIKKIGRTNARAYFELYQSIPAHDAKRQALVDLLTWREEADSLQQLLVSQNEKLFKASQQRDQLISTCRVLEGEWAKERREKHWWRGEHDRVLRDYHAALVCVLALGFLGLVMLYELLSHL